jgi:hypothetical protein
LPLYGFFTACPPSSSPFLHAASQTSAINLTGELLMDIAFIAAAAGLWGVMVLLVWGFGKLDAKAGGRS